MHQVPMLSFHTDNAARSPTISSMHNAQKRSVREYSGDDDKSDSPQFAAKASVSNQRPDYFDEEEQGDYREFVDKDGYMRRKSTVRMHFGKHKGKLLHEIDRDYVLWMKSENVLVSRYHRDPEFIDEMRWVFPDIFEYSIGHPDT